MNTMSSQWKRLKQIEFKKWKIEFAVTILIIMVLPVNGKKNSTEAAWITYPIYITTNGTQLNIDIEENITHLQCKWSGEPCYIECTSANLTMNLSDPFASWEIVKDSYKMNFNLNSSGDFKSKCIVTKCIPENMPQLMHEICNQNNDAKNLKRLMNMKKACWEVVHDHKVSYTYLKEEKNCIDAIIRIPFKGKDKHYNLGDLAMTVVRMDMGTINKGHVQISAPKVFGYDVPVETWIPMEPFQNALGEHGKVAVVSYTAQGVQLFMAHQKNVSVMSQVIRVEVAGRDIKDLTNPLVINFTVNNSTSVSASHRLSCQFYNDKVQYQWSDFGSLTTLDYVNSSNIVKCSYDHMTPFAVLLGDLQIDEHNWRILSYISYVGCGISLFFNAVSLFVYIVKRTSNRNYSNSVHASLSAALLFLNTSYLFSEWTATLGVDGACVFVAVAMEYSLLCCFSWMAIEAIHLYLLLVKVFNTHVRHYMVKLSLFGWGVPAVFVGVSLSVYDIWPLYGTKTITLSDTHTESKICWITNSTFLYGMNLTCLSLMLLLNMTILSTVVCQIIKLRRWDTTHGRLSSCTNICTVLGLTFLLGMTWGLAFLSYGYTNYPVLYLFCICNSLQGLFMFLWICSTTRSTGRPVAKTASPFKMFTSTSTPNKSSCTDITGHSYQH